MAKTRAAYRWRGELFCDGDIVDTLLDESPWDAWLDSNEQPGPETNVERALDSIAEFFSINRKNPRDVEANDFPVKLRGAPEPPQFCRVCMKWFS